MTGPTAPQTAAAGDTAADPFDYWRRQVAGPRHVDPELSWPDADVMVVIRELVTAHDEAIRAESSAELVPVDVERLARALVFRRYGIRLEEANPADVVDAAAIVREYQALAPADAAGGREEEAG